MGLDNKCAMPALIEFLLEFFFDLFPNFGEKHKRLADCGNMMQNSQHKHNCAP